MKWLDLVRFAVFMGVLTILVKPVGGYLARVFGRERTGFDPILLPVAMIAGRFGLMIPALALAGCFGNQKSRPQTAGTIETDTPLFAMLLLAVILLTGALTYLPALCLGPVHEQLSASTQYHVNEKPR